MVYSILYGHLEEIYVSKGETVFPNQPIGKMGSTGKSTGPHLHLGVTQTAELEIFRMSEVLSKISDFTEYFKQCHYFIDKELFGITDLEQEEADENGENLDVLVTSHFADPKYNLPNWLLHTGWDLLPSDRFKTKKHFDIYNNRSKNMKIVKTGNDSGYGLYVIAWIEL